MDVTLPNGVVIRDVPEGTNKFSIMEKAIQKGLATPEDFGQESANPTEGMSGVDRFMAGAGKAVHDLGRGVQQIGANVGNRIGLVSDETTQGIQANVDEAARRDQPLMETGAGMAGNVAGNIASMTIPGAAGARGAQALNMGRTARGLRAVSNPTNYRSAAASGATYGGLMPTQTGESRATNIALGAAGGTAGQAGVRGLGRVAQPVRNARSWAVDRLQRAGVPMDLAQRTRSEFLQRIRSGLNTNPITAGGQRNIGEQQQQAYTRAVLGTIGEEADAATPRVMGGAKKRIGQVFDDVAENNPIVYDQALEDGMADLMGAASRELNESQMRVLGNQVDEILSKAAANEGRIPGQAFQNLKQSLDRLSRGSDSSTGFWARELRELMHDALERSASPEDVSRLQLARQQWANMRTIENAVSKDGEGMISPLRLSNSLFTKANRWRSVYGGGDQELVELAEAGRQVLPETLPDSGTAGRLLSSALTSGGFGGGAYAVTGDPQTAAIAAGAGLGGPKATQYLMNRAPSRARYLAEGLRQGPARNLLESPARHSAVGAPSRQALTAYLLSQRASAQ